MVVLDTGNSSFFLIRVWQNVCVANSQDNNSQRKIDQHTRRCHSSGRDIIKQKYTWKLNIIKKNFTLSWRISKLASPVYVSLLTLPAQDMQNGWRGSLEIDLFIIHTYVCGCAKVLPIRDLINYLYSSCLSWVLCA